MWIKITEHWEVFGEFSSSKHVNDSAKEGKLKISQSLSEKSHGKDRLKISDSLLEKKGTKNDHRTSEDFSKMSPKDDIEDWITEFIEEALSTDKENDK